MNCRLTRIALLALPAVIVITALTARHAYAEDVFGLGRVGLGYGFVSGEGLDSGLLSTSFGFEVDHWTATKPEAIWGVELELDLLSESRDLLFAAQPFLLGTLVADTSDPASIPSLAIGARLGIALVEDSTYLPLLGQISFRWYINVGLVVWVDLPIGPAFKLDGPATTPDTVFVFTPRAGISFIFA